MDKTPRQIEEERRSEAESVRRRAEVARNKYPPPDDDEQIEGEGQTEEVQRKLRDERRAEVQAAAVSKTKKYSPEHNDEAIVKPDERSGAPLSTEAKVDHLQTSILAGFDLLAQSLAIEVTQAQNKLLADGGGAANAGPDTKASVQQLGDMLNRFKVTVETLKKGAIGHQRRQEDLKSDRV